MRWASWELSSTGPLSGTPGRRRAPVGQDAGGVFAALGRAEGDSRGLRGLDETVLRHPTDRSGSGRFKSCPATMPTNVRSPDRAPWPRSGRLQERSRERIGRETAAGRSAMGVGGRAERQLTASTSRRVQAERVRPIAASLVARVHVTADFVIPLT